MPRQSITQNVRCDEDFQCGRCTGFFTSVSGSRPPVYNPDNCSCREVAHPSHNFGSSTVLLQTEQIMYDYDNTAILFERPSPPVSYASSNQSRGHTGQEGLERELPNTQFESGFLIVVPEAGLGEAQHRRTSLRREMSYQMRCYMQEQQEEDESDKQAQHQLHTITYGTGHGQTHSGNNFLSQDVYMRPASGKGSGRTRSWDSQGSGGSGESALETWAIAPNDPIRGIGAWADQNEGHGLGIAGISLVRSGYDGYPVSMSGMTESGVSV